ncbi:MAG: thioesterase family protein [Armatimonadota bacterium]|nr:thioesterase family protein [Armatimonadota bacterium]MDR7402635.1 thioesterase family protein [Armatimonadota bacterium]MDR7404987.1 thioesterase family protein [Armatimonadota bacterium]MDR7436763.1 thioesterase family protein [Armatimonadota bacterium]MDR7472710.1 thioesterase family protein [Armatimonadota bacterium]
METPPAPVVSTEVRVRYAETDAMGVAHHTAYLVWFEAGRTEYTRAAGLPYREVEEAGTRLVVVEAHCRYHRPARYDDVVVVQTRVRDLGRATVTFGYEVRRRDDGALLADGYTVHAATDAAGRVRRLPEEVRRALAGAGVSVGRGEDR